MFFSKAMIIRVMAIALVVIAGWTIWKRVDAVIDNYQKYYDVALIQKMWQQETDRFNSQFDGFGSQFGDPGKNSKPGDDIDKKWDAYQKTSPFKAENKPVPQVADEYTAGYYYGLWNFFIRSGFASIFSLIIIGSLCIILIRQIWRRVTEAAIEKFMSRF